MMRGYDAPRGGYGPPRDPREYHNQYYWAQGPSPWIPATLLGVIVLITAMPYMRTPDATIAYHTAVRNSSRFPAAGLWIPVLGVIALQFFGGPWYHGYGEGQAYGRWGVKGPGIYDYPSGAYGEFLERMPVAWAPTTTELHGGIMVALVVVFVESLQPV